MNGFSAGAMPSAFFGSPRQLFRSRKLLNLKSLRLRALAHDLRDDLLFDILIQAFDITIE